MGLAAFEAVGLPVRHQVLFSSTSSVWSQSGAACFLILLFHVNLGFLFSINDDDFIYNDQCI